MADSHESKNPLLSPTVIAAIVSAIGLIIVALIALVPREQPLSDVFALLTAEAIQTNSALNTQATITSIVPTDAPTLPPATTAAPTSSPPTAIPNTAPPTIVQSPSSLTATPQSTATDDAIPCTGTIQSTGRATIITQIYSDHSTRGNLMQPIRVGTIVTVIEQFSDTPSVWYSIQTIDGNYLGWIQSIYIRDCK
jgi:hypothetical protein